MSSKYYHTQRLSSSIKGLLTPLGGWDSHFSGHQPIIPSREPSPFKGIFPKNRWSWKLFFIALKPYPSFGGQESLLILQESQKPLFQQGRIPSSLLDIPRPVPLYCISYLLGSVCGVDFLPGYLFFPSTARKVAQGCPKVHEGVQMCTKRCTIVRKRYARCMQVHERCGQVCKGSTEV